MVFFWLWSALVCTTVIILMGNPGAMAEPVSKLAIKPEYNYQWNTCSKYTYLAHYLLQGILQNWSRWQVLWWMPHSLHRCGKLYCNLSFSRGTYVQWLGRSLTGSPSLWQLAPPLKSSQLTSPSPLCSSKMLKPQSKKTQILGYKIYPLYSLSWYTPELSIPQ